MNFINKFFLLCSGASLSIISKCPDFEKIKYISIGITIFFTSILAFISAFYALTLIFSSIFLIILGSIFWALIIFNLDRYIVMSLRTTESKSHNFLISLPRLIIALLVAVVISKPIEIKLLENEIDSFLDKKNIESIYLIDKKYQEDIVNIDKTISNITRFYEEKVDLGNKYYEDYMCECNGTCGTLVRGRGIECKARKAKYESYMGYLQMEEIKKDSLILLESFKKTEIENLINQEKEIITSKVGFGFFDKVKALNKVDNISSSFILLLFIMIETAPMFTKLLTKRGPYDSMILKTEYQFESDYLRSASNFDIQREQATKINKINADLAVKSKENKMKNIERQKAFERYEKIRNNSKNNS